MRSLIHYFKALEALGGNPHDGAKVVAKMKEMPTDDPLFGKGMIRIDGRAIHPAYLFEVKSPAELKYPWDYYKLVATIPADEAFRPLAREPVPAGQEIVKLPIIGQKSLFMADGLGWPRIFADCTACWQESS